MPSLTKNSKNRDVTFYSNTRTRKTAAVEGVLVAGRSWGDWVGRETGERWLNGERKLVAGGAAFRQPKPELKTLLALNFQFFPNHKS